ncbi:MAG TPA: DUF1016 N-terminal domain-containing protein, partial [bacterium]|nr:DUF1016 N-terminal domain-containing protein [bacterium]
MKKAIMMSKNRDIQIHLNAVKEIKGAILKSRYTAAKLVNKEMLLLYFFVGKYVSFNTRNKNWGKGAIENISAMLQQELNGLRGFSPTNLKNMRIFFEEWIDLEAVFATKSTVILFDFMKDQNRQMPSDDLMPTIRQTLSDELEEAFFSVGFSNHIAILNSVKETSHRWFYLQKSSSEYWTHSTLKYHLKQHLHKQIANFNNNFDRTLQQNTFKEKALMAFKDEMLLDFVNVHDAYEEPDERVLEQEIIQNITKFI